MSQLIARNDSVIFVSVSMASLSEMVFVNGSNLLIERDAVATKAGKKQVVVTQPSSSAAYTFSQEDVNKFEVSQYIDANPFHDNFTVSTHTVFTADTSDEVIQEKALQWCKEVLAIYTDKINRINQNLSAIVDRSNSASDFFCDTESDFK